MTNILWPSALHRRSAGTVLAAAVCAGLVYAASPAALSQPTATSLSPASSPSSHRHRILFHVASDETAAMSHAISAADNAMKFYRARGEAVDIEIVANGAGVRMMRADVSPVAPSIAYLHKAYPSIVLSACGTTLRLMQEREGHAAPLLEGVRVTPAGIARIVELEEDGWSYVRS